MLKNVIKNMKKIILILFVLFSFPTVYSQAIGDFSVNIDITNKDRVDVEMVFVPTENLIAINIPIYENIFDIQTNQGKCYLVKDVQQILKCEPDFSFFQKNKNITIKFWSNSMVRGQDEIKTFSFDIPILWRTERILIFLKLPVGAAVSDDIVIPVSPSENEIGSDGRRIFLKWFFENKQPDDIIPLRVYYEETVNSSIIAQIQTQWFMLLIFVITVFGVLMYWQVNKKRSGLVLSVLNENERIILEIIQNQPEEKVDQRKIVGLSGFSKAKVSRIIRNLEERGIIETERIGRKNKIRLKKKFIKK